MAVRTPYASGILYRSSVSYSSLELLTVLASGFQSEFEWVVFFFTD
jgi:hypothetical protein